jgi:hypothetical protein
MAKKKSFERFCFSCDVDFTIKLSEENIKMEPTYCPFCGEEIDSEDTEELESEEESNDEDDNNKKHSSWD